MFSAGSGVSGSAAGGGGVSPRGRGFAPKSVLFLKSRAEEGAGGHGCSTPWALHAAKRDGQDGAYKTRADSL